MKIKITVSLALILVTTMCISQSFSQRASYVVVAESKGQVHVVRNNTVIKVKKGISLYENDVIQTTKNSSVVLLFQDGTTLSVAENSKVTICELITKVSLHLDSGKIKSKVVPRQTSYIFEVKTPVSVASVRGTEFILIFENNNSVLYVLEGEVNFEDFKGNAILVFAMEQCFASEEGIGNKFSIDKEKLKDLEKGFISVVERFKEGKIEEQPFKDEISNLKEELKNFVLETKSDKYYINEIVYQIKEADFQTGRTLTDVHGNLTRVEQVISRNRSNTIEFMNITKRDSYVYKGYFDYADIVKSNKPRVDIFRLGIEFNQSLPEKISDWPKFISEQKDNFWPTKVYCELTNLKDRFYSETTFTKIVKEEPIYEYHPQYDQYGNFIGYEQVQIGTEKKTKFESTTKNIVSNDDVVYTIDTDYDENVKGKLPEGESKEGDDGKLWFWSYGPLPVKEDINNDGKYDNKDILWVQIEGYLINNNGEILTPSYFTGESKDPFTVLKEIAVESCVFVRKDDGTGVKPAEPFFNRNIDLVATPDIIITLAKNVAMSFKDVQKD